MLYIIRGEVLEYVNADCEQDAIYIFESMYPEAESIEIVEDDID